MLCCNKIIKKCLMKNKRNDFLIHTIFRTINNRFILLLQKGVYPYEYMDDFKNLIKHYYLKKEIYTVT